MTELLWDGKYDKDGRKTAPLRVALPFQTVETVNESTADRLRTRDLFAEGKAADWRNGLFRGDRKHVLPSILEELAGQVNFTYVAPVSVLTEGDWEYLKVPQTESKQLQADEFADTAILT